MTLFIDHICKKFGSTTILDHVTLQIAPSSIVGLAGPSGSGKSTLLRVIQGLDQPDSGTITYDGKVGFMFQDFQLFPHMTVMENLIYAPMVSGSEDKKAIQAQAILLLEQLGIESKATQYPAYLSGGQKQRVALARSLMINPNILLCDEPTSGLDVTTTQDVANLLKSIGDLGMTIMIASHDLDFLTQVSDRIILLKNGVIKVDIGLSGAQDTVDAIDAVRQLKKFY